MIGHNKKTLIDKLPTDHFGQITENTLSSLLNGQCYCVTGIPGYGMEFFAKHIRKELNLIHPEIKIITINLELEGRNVSEVNKIIDDNIEGLLKGSGAVLILAEILESPSDATIKLLNGLRWKSENKISILSVANHSIISDIDSYSSPANDIFKHPEIVQTFSRSGIKKIIEMNNKEYNWHIPLKLADTVYELSGGSPALAKYICMSLYEEGLKLINMPHKLVETQPLKQRLIDIENAIHGLSLGELIKIGIITEKGELFSKLLSFYLKNKETNTVKSLFPSLSATERKLLGAFLINKNKVVSKDQISIILGQGLNTYSEWAIYKIVARLRNKLPDGYTIKTVKGKGWVLSVD